MSDQEDLSRLAHEMAKAFVQANRRAAARVAREVFKDLWDEIRGSNRHVARRRGKVMVWHRDP